MGALESIGGLGKHFRDQDPRQELRIEAVDQSLGFAAGEFAVAGHEQRHRPESGGCSRA